MIGTRLINNALEKSNNINIRESKFVKKVFKKFKELERYEKRMADASLSEKERKDAEELYVYVKKEIRNPLWRLAWFEVEYSDWEKSISDEKKLMILKEAYDEHHDYIFDSEVEFRLKKNPPCSKRKAHKQMKELVKAVRKDDPLLVKLFLSEESKNFHEEYLYTLIDWLLNDFEKMIDEIEPVRRQYIISKQGKVTVEEVEGMINEKFPEKHKDYDFWLSYRPRLEFLYYPDLKL